MRTQRNTTTQIISAIVPILILLSRLGLDFSRSIRSLILNILARLFGSFGGLVLNSAGVVLLFGFLLSLAIEMCQLLFRLGWFEVDDILHNVLGTYLGICLYRRAVKRTST